MFFWDVAFLPSTPPWRLLSFPLEKSCGHDTYHPWQPLCPEARGFGVQIQQRLSNVCKFRECSLTPKNTVLVMLSRDARSLPSPPLLSLFCLSLSPLHSFSLHREKHNLIYIALAILQLTTQARLASKSQRFISLEGLKVWLPCLACRIPFYSFLPLDLAMRNHRKCVCVCRNGQVREVI